MTPAIGLADADRAETVGLPRRDVVVVAVLVATYATKRGLPAKYLVPGTLMLVLFVIYPIPHRKASGTNLGDGTRSTKEEAVAQIIGSSVGSDDAPRYNLTIGTEGSVTGPFAFFLVSKPTGRCSRELPTVSSHSGDVTVANDKITAADGYTMLNPGQVNAAAEALKDFTVPTASGAIIDRSVSAPPSRAPTLRYDKEADTITDVTDGTVYRVQAGRP